VHEGNTSPANDDNSPVMKHSSLAKIFKDHSGGGVWLGSSNCEAAVYDTNTDIYQLEQRNSSRDKTKALIVMQKMR
jgi:hypothetical protein